VNSNSDNEVQLSER